MDPFIGQVSQFAGNFAPRGWAACNGQLLPISENTALFSILGTTYGGDGRTTFGLPNLKGRTQVHAGRGPGLPVITIGQVGGGVTIPASGLPAHNHSTSVSTDNGTTNNPTGAVPATIVDANRRSLNMYAPTGNAAGGATGATGSGGDFRNPFTAVTHIIALQGTYPSRS